MSCQDEANDNIPGPGQQTSKPSSSKEKPLAVKRKSSFSLDVFLVHYNRFISSSANQDKGMKLLQWTLWLFSRIYPSRKDALKKIGGDISFARYILRFYGLPSTLEAISNRSWEDKKSGTLGRITGKLMAWAMLAYYPLEHVAYVQWTSPELLQLPNGANRYNANTLSAYSCRFWLVYLLAEMTQSVMRLRRLYREEEAEKDETALVTLEQSIRNEQLQIARSALFTLPCVHWALPKWDTDPWLSEGACNGMLWLESVVSMYQAIRSYSLANP